MQEGYKVNEPVGSGLYIEICNFIGLNEIGHYRYSTYSRFEFASPSVIGLWKPKSIKS
jgi:hypothetical protein